MRKYAEIRPEESEDVEVYKEEETSLPKFSKEVPLDSKRTETKGIVSIKYGWPPGETNTIKVKYLEFMKGEKHFENLYRISEYDGVDRSTLHYDDTTYTIRKTTSQNAKRLFSSSKDLSSCVERIVGYILTLSGNAYVIARVKGMCWVFDEQLAKKLAPTIKFINIEDLSEKQKADLSRMVIEKLTELHKKRVLFGRPVSLKNVLMTTNSLVLIDLRDMKPSGKNCRLVDEFRKTMAELLESGMATNEDVFHAIAHYLAVMGSACKEWHKENKGKKTDTLGVAVALEESIYN